MSNELVARLHLQIGVHTPFVFPRKTARLFILIEKFGSHANHIQLNIK